MVWWTFQ